MELSAKSGQVGPELNELPDGEATDEVRGEVRLPGSGRAAEQAPRHDERLAGWDAERSREIPSEQKLLDKRHGNPALDTLSAARQRVVADSQQQVVKRLAIELKNRGSGGGGDGSQNKLGRKY